MSKCLHTQLDIEQGCFASTTFWVCYKLVSCRIYIVDATQTAHTSVNFQIQSKLAPFCCLEAGGGAGGGALRQTTNQSGVGVAEVEVSLVSRITQVAPLV